MDTSNDYYAVLGVDSQANASTIKAAFKKLALQYHPDVNSGADAQERMRGILQAYQVLSNPQKRQEYDARRRGEYSGVSAGETTERAARGGQGAAVQKAGRFAFPDLRQTPTSSLHIVVDGLPYQLSSAQAESLKWDGLLRGDASAADSAAFYHCQRCHHRWLARGSARPTSCPQCQARDWADYLLLRCSHCQAVFASRELRDPLRGNVLYHPYELFPLCPHCRRSQWCPAENKRVHSLRAAAARRSALLWSGIAFGCALIVAGLAFFLLH
ncbi:MAG TPA: DnaJ domain-containing protein [Ktedonobacteraceae bacterium]|nr:DnaJ domain-containing protein [Ktedonobacteraceae bacterium]